MGWDGKYQPETHVMCGRWELELDNGLPVDGGSGIPTWRQYYLGCLLTYEEAGDGRPGSGGDFRARVHAVGGSLAMHENVPGPAEAGEAFDGYMRRASLGRTPMGLDEMLATRGRCSQYPQGRPPKWVGRDSGGAAS